MKHKWYYSPVTKHIGAVGCLFASAREGYLQMPIYSLKLKEFLEAIYEV